MRLLFKGGVYWTVVFIVLGSISLVPMLPITPQSTGCIHLQLGQSRHDAWPLVHAIVCQPHLSGVTGEVKKILCRYLWKQIMTWHLSTEN